MKALTQAAFSFKQKVGRADKTVDPRFEESRTRMKELFSDINDIYRFLEKQQIAVRNLSQAMETMGQNLGRFFKGSVPGSFDIASRGYTASAQIFLSRIDVLLVHFKDLSALHKDNRVQQRDESLLDFDRHNASRAKIMSKQPLDTTKLADVSAKLSSTKALYDRQNADLIREIDNIYERRYKDVEPQILELTSHFSTLFCEANRSFSQLSENSFNNTSDSSPSHQLSSQPPSNRISSPPPRKPCNQYDKPSSNYVTPPISSKPYENSAPPPPSRHHRAPPPPPPTIENAPSPAARHHRTAPPPPYQEIPFSPPSNRPSKALPMTPLVDSSLVVSKPLPTPPPKTIEQAIGNAAGNAVANAARDSVIQERAGKALSDAALDSSHQKQVGESIANNTSNPFLSALASNESVQRNAGKMFSTAASNKAVQKRVGSAVASQAENEENQKRIMHGAKQGVKGAGKTGVHAVGSFVN